MIETERTDWITPHRFIAHLVERRISRVKILLNSDPWLKLFENGASQFP